METAEEAKDLDARIQKGLDGERIFREKICQLMSRVGYIRKDKTNLFHNYKYVSAEAVMKKIQPELVDLGLITIPNIEVVQKDRDLVIVKVAIRMTDVDSGASFFFEGLGSGTDHGDKAVMKASTAAFKYAWMTLLSIATGDDPEGDNKTDEDASQETSVAPEDESQEKQETLFDVEKAVKGINDLDILREMYKKRSPGWTAAGLGTRFNQIVNARAAEIKAASREGAKADLRAEIEKIGKE